MGCEINGRALPFGSRASTRRATTGYVGKWHLATDAWSAIPQERRGGSKDYWMAADVLEFTSHGYNGYVYNADNERVPFVGYRAECINNFAIDFLHGRKEQTEPFFCSSARSSRIIRMTVGGMKGRTARGRSLRIFSLRGSGLLKPVHRARTSAIGGKIIPIIWGAVTAWITTLDVWLIRSKSRECGKTLSLSTRRITAAIF